MSHWRNSKMECLYWSSSYNVPQEETVDCEVVITDDKISISYPDAVYIGKNNNTEHYLLKWEENGEIKGEGSLHRMNKSSKILEGYWKEEGTRGFWRIHLDNQ
jgi:hypothetical protein